MPRSSLARLRLAAQGIGTATSGTPALDAPAFASPAEVVGHLLALQAQDYAGATWSIALRTATAVRADIEAAIAAREIVRSWPMRGTLHIVPAEELRWMLQLTGQRTVQSAAGRHRALGLDAAQLTLAARIAETAVGDAGQLSRPALLAAFEAGGLSTEGQRGSHILLYLSVTGLLVFATREGNQHRFALLDEWVPSHRPLAGDEALAEFARRYFWSHGPASDRDFAWWSSLTLTQARRGLAIVASELDVLEVDGVQYWHRPGLEPAPSGVAVLPGFDEFVLGYRDRTAQLASQWAERIVPGGNGVFMPTIVADGQIVGTWKSSRAAVAVELFAPLPARRRSALLQRFARYGAFLGAEVQVDLQPER